MNRMPYRTYSSFLKEQFGSNIYKAPINIGASCPNRDGTKSTGGCIYCSPRGSGTGSQKRVREQINDFIRGRQGQYIAYFQSYSNMYGNEDKLIEQYRDALSHKQICGISIATRPDTVNEYIIKHIRSLNTYIQIELGLETVNADTLNRINRHDTPESFVQACSIIREILPQAHIVGHMIIGLPGDQYSDYMKTAVLIDKHCNGIKFHNLYIERDMPIYSMFAGNSIELMKESDYMAVLADILHEIRDDLVVHRLKSTSSGENLIAPLWTLNRHFHRDFLQFFNNRKEEL